MNVNKGGTFSTRPMSAGMRQKVVPGFKKPPTKNNFSKQQKEPAAKLVQPEWNSSMQENPYKLSKEELLRRKLSMKSKNENQAKAELSKKYNQLQSGKIPKEYEDVVKKEKKYTSKAAFIQNQELQREYENRCFISYNKLREDELEREGMLTEFVDQEQEMRPPGGGQMMRRSNSAAGVQASVAMHQMQQQTFNQRQQPLPSGTWREDEGESALKEEWHHPAAISQQQQTAPQPGGLTFTRAMPVVTKSAMPPKPPAPYLTQPAQPSTFTVQSQQKSNEPKNDQYSRYFGLQSTTIQNQFQPASSIGQGGAGADLMPSTVHEVKNEMGPSSATAAAPLNLQASASKYADLAADSSDVMKKYDDFMSNLKKSLNEPSSSVTVGGAPMTSFSSQLPQPTAEVSASVKKEYDYLDFEENEKRLKELLKQNDLNRYRNLLGDNTQEESVEFQEFEKQKAEMEKQQNPGTYSSNLEMNKLPSSSQYDYTVERPLKIGGGLDDQLLPVDDLDQAFSNLNKLIEKNEDNGPLKKPEAGSKSLAMTAFSQQSESSRQPFAGGFQQPSKAPNQQQAFQNQHHQQQQPPASGFGLKQQPQIEIKVNSNPLDVRQNLMEKYYGGGASVKQPDPAGQQFSKPAPPQQPWTSSSNSMAPQPYSQYPKRENFPEDDDLDMIPQKAPKPSHHQPTRIDVPSSNDTLDNMAGFMNRHAPPTAAPQATSKYPQFSLPTGFPSRDEGISTETYTQVYKQNVMQQKQQDPRSIQVGGPPKKKIIDMQPKKPAMKSADEEEEEELLKMREMLLSTQAEIDKMML